MAFTPYFSKIGSDECKDAYPLILSQDNSGMTDNALLSVMRVLLNEDRIQKSKQEDHKVQAVVNCDHLYIEPGSEYNKDMFIHDDSPFCTLQYGIWIQSFEGDEANEFLKESEKFNADYAKKGWKKLDTASQYIDKDGHALVYQNEKKQGVMITTTKPFLLKVIHLAASCLPTLMPWFFKDKPLTENETAMLRMLYDQKEKEFLKVMDDVFAAGDFYGKKLQAALKGFCSRNYDNEISRGQRNVDSIRRDIDNLLSSVRDKTRSLENAQIQLAAIRDRACCTDDVEKELADYLKRNKALTFLKKSDDQIYIGYTGYLNDCDEAYFRNCVEKKANNRSYVYEDTPYDIELTRDFFIAIWKTHRFNLRTYCEWVIDSSCCVDAVMGSNMEGRDEMMKDRIRQPHIDRHGCYDGYRQTFSDLASRHDFVGALTLISASSASINWNDSTVVHGLMRSLFCDNDRKTFKCLEDADGNQYTVDEVFEILRKEKENAVA